MAITAASLVVRVGADTKDAEASLTGFERRLQQLGKSAMVVGAGLTAGLTLPLLAAGRAVMGLGSEFERQANVLQAVTGAMASQMAAVDRLARELGADMRLPATSAADAARAMTELAKAGLSVDQSLAAARGTIQLAKAAQVDEAVAAEIAGNALNAFGLRGSEATRVADLLAASANSASGEITDMAYGLKMAAAVWSTSNQSIEDTVASIGLMANAGIHGAQAGTSLKQMMLALIAPTDRAKAIMQGLGISLYDAGGKMLPLRDIIVQFNAALADLSEQQRNEALARIFGSDAIRAGQIILGRSVEQFDQMREAVSRQGAAAELAEAKTRGLGGALDGLQSQVETAALSLAGPMLGSLEGLVRGAAEVVGGLASVNPEWVRFAAGVLGVLAAAGPTITVFGALAMALTFLVSPLGLLIAAVAVLGGLWATNWFGMRDTLQQAWAGGIQPALASLTAWLGQHLPQLLQGLALLFAWWALTTATSLAWGAGQAALHMGLLGKAFLAARVQAVAAAVATAAAWLAGALPAVVTAVGGIVAALAALGWPLAAVIAIAAALFLAWQNNWGGIREITDRVVGFVADRIRDFLNWLKTLPIVGEHVQGMADSLGQAGEGLGQFAADAGEGVQGLLEQFRQGFPEIQKYLRMPLTWQNKPSEMDEIREEIALLKQRNEALNPRLPDGPGLPEIPGLGDEGGSLKDLRDQMAATLGGTQALIDHLVATDPAALAAAQAVDTLKLSIVGLKDQQEATNRDLAAARGTLQAYQDRVSAISSALADAKNRLQELGRVRLPGQNAQDEQLYWIEWQLKKLEAAKKGLDVSGILPTAGGAAILAGLPRSIAELQRLRETLAVRGDLTWGPRLREIDRAINGLPREMPYEQLLAAIAGTKNEIGDLEGALKGAQAAVAGQQALIKGLERSSAALTAEIERQERALALAEDRQKAVNKALGEAFDWFVNDKIKLMELGGEAVNTATLVDSETQRLLATTRLYAQEEASLAVKAINEALGAYELAKARLAAGLFPGQQNAPPPHLGIDEPRAGGGPILEPVLGRGLWSGRTYSFAEDRGEYVLTPEQLAALRGGGRPAGDTFVYQQNAPVYGFRNFEDAVQQAAERNRRRGRR